MVPEIERLDNRRVLVTGASRGIGRDIAQLLAGLGAEIVLVARNRAAVDRCVAELPGNGHRGLSLDVSDERAWRSAVVEGALHGVDGLVTAAALLTPIGRVGSYSSNDFWHTMRVNVLGTMLAIESCLSSLERSRGSIVTFAGGGATSPLPRYDAYATSKAAVTRLTENLAIELLDAGVRVNGVSPGFVATDIHAATIAAGPARAGEAYFAETERHLREGASPARNASELTAFLLSGRAHGITGRLISAQWDPWRTPAFCQRLRDEPDLATLRRIDEQFFSALSAARREANAKDAVE